jgi:hypothetical protein
LSGKASLLKEEFEFTFNTLEKSLEGLDDEGFLYKITETSNSIQAILYHLSNLTRVNIPSIIKGEQYSTPEAEINDPGDVEYSFDKLWNDIASSRDVILGGVGDLSDNDLEEIVPLMAGPYPRKIGLFAYLGELFHHRGQIAFIRGTIHRIKHLNTEHSTL